MPTQVIYCYISNINITGEKNEYFSELTNYPSRRSEYLENCNFFLLSLTGPMWFSSAVSKFKKQKH